MGKGLQNKSVQTVGILGGGQLAQMLAIEAKRNGIPVSVFCSSPDDPAARVIGNIDSNVFIGDLKNPSDLKRFLSSVSTLTFESEFIDISILKNALANQKCAVAPSLKLMEALQDRKTQKKLLSDFDLPLSEEVKDLINSKQLVAKARRNGYDGYGTHILKTKVQLIQFLKKNASILGTFIFEKLIPFNRELALTAVRSSRGDIIFYPLVEWKAKEAKCFWVRGPTEHPKLSQLKKKIKKFLAKTNYVGAISFELFDLGKDLLINEVAPRVHNSAHHTLDSCPSSQFLSHLKAIRGLPLSEKSAEPYKSFAMVNLIGSTKKIPSWDPPKESKLYWYGKSQNRPGRKMGHLNTLGKTPEKALKIVLKDLKGFKL